MPARTDLFDLGRLQLQPGMGRRLELAVSFEPFAFGGQTYAVPQREVPVTLDLSRMTSGGYSMRLRFDAELSGPCMRCLQPATPSFSIDSRETDQPGGGDEMRSPYVIEGEELDLRAWARDALVLELPAQILHAPDCAGLCPQCGKDLNVEPHEHEKPPDPRWAALRDLLPESS
jgi:uncharacterized protein